jgi:hypothetical protein
MAGGREPPRARFGSRASGRAPGTAEVRLLFVFDPVREAIVLVAGDKAGRWSAWYAEAIPLAEERYAAYRHEAHEEEK